MATGERRSLPHRITHDHGKARRVCANEMNERAGRRWRPAYAPTVVAPPDAAPRRRRSEASPVSHVVAA